MKILARKLKAILLDMDGVIVDSMPYHLLHGLRHCGHTV